MRVLYGLLFGMIAAGIAVALGLLMGWAIYVLLGGDKHYSQQSWGNNNVWTVEQELFAPPASASPTSALGVSHVGR